MNIHVATQHILKNVVLYTARANKQMPIEWFTWGTGTQ